MSEVKTNRYEVHQWYCAHCIWNDNVKKTGKNKFGKPEFFGETKNLNIFSMFGKLRYTFNFVSKIHVNSYKYLEHLNLINEVKQYAESNFKDSKYDILHNSGFNLKRYGGKEHIHILLTILPGNEARTEINNKYGSIQGLPENLIKNSLNNILIKNVEHIGYNNRIELIIPKITQEIGEIKSDEIKEYKTQIEKIFSEYKYLEYDFKDIINLLTKESISVLYGDGIYRYRENTNVDEQYLINFENISEEPGISLIGSDPFNKRNKIISHLNNIIKNENKNNKKLFTRDNADYLEYYLLLKKNDDGTFSERLLYSYESMDLNLLSEQDLPSYLWIKPDGHIFIPSNSTQMEQLKNQIKDFKDILKPDFRMNIKEFQMKFDDSLEFLSLKLKERKRKRKRKRKRLEYRKQHVSTGEWT